ncbi:chemotaxis protein CheA [Caballeronia pedi]|uniref:Chemotaxis protein CheA n=1 Tax=Caballeronia pedi TaxID=1777141 RepID=A0A158A793_9BURK|nr:hypothetical protein [Caballeronia pedi]SAK53569.1 chemotaxis protein CheA [Caballeronia pedi]
MNKTTLQLACAVLFCAAQLAHADTTANSSSGSVSGSTSTGIGQGGGSSLNNIGTSANSTANTSSNSSSVGGLGVATASGGRSTAQGGSSNVNISLSMPSLTNSGNDASGTDATGKASTGPGTSAFDTRTTVDYNQSSYSVRTTPSIAAPALTTTLSDTCMGSASFGLSITGFGATGGTTLVDQACVRRLDAREFRAMGLTDVALALLCQSDANRRAVEATGHLCPGTTTPLAKSGADAVLSDDEKYRDPLVRARLGLPVTAANNPEVNLKAAEPAQAKPAPAKQVAQPTPVASRVYDQSESTHGVEVASTPIGEKIEVSLVK